MLFGKLSKAVNEPAFFRVQVIGRYVLDLPADRAVADQVIYGGIKIIRDADQGLDIRLNAVIFVLVDRLLTDTDGLSKLLLGYGSALPEHFQVFEHDNNPLYIMITTYKRFIKRLKIVIENNCKLLYNGDGFINAENRRFIMKKIERFLLVMSLVLLALLCKPMQADAATVDDLTYYIMSKTYVYIDDCDTEATGELVIPETIDGYPVKYIDSQAFLGCQKLTSVTIPNGVLKIGDSAFRNCTGLITVNLPDTIEVIGNQAFDGCTKLTNLNIPSGIQSVGYGAFSGCTALNIKTYNNAKYVGNEENPYLVLFDTTSSSVSQCTIHPDAKVIAARAFYGNKYLQEITIPGSVYRIDEYAFYNCSGLKSVTICEGVSKIESCAFYGCSNLANITLPDSIESIGSLAFSGCSNLQNLYISDIAHWCSMNYSESSFNNPFRYADNVYVNNQLVRDLVIPDTVTSIGTYAFCGCVAWDSVTIPSSVTQIGEGAFYNCDNLTDVILEASIKKIDTYVFYSCDQLTSITIPDSVTSIGSYAFQACKNLSLINMGSGLTSIGSYAFASCTSLTEITIPDSVTGIGEYAFRGNQNLTRVTLGKNVKRIYTCTFSGCTALTDIVIPVSVSTIQASAFLNCTALANVYYTGNQQNWNSISIDDYGNEPLLNATLHLNYVPCTHSYTDYTDLECDLCGYVRTVKVVSIYQTPAVLEYDLFQDSLDVTDGILEFLYSDGTKGKIEMTTDMVSGFDNTVLGTQTLTVTYHGAVTSYAVEVVIGNPEELAITTLPKTLSYLTGDKISLSGIALELVYPGGQSLALDVSYVTVDDVDTKTPGRKTVTLHFGNLSASYEICIHEMHWVTVDSALYPESVHNYLSNTNDVQSLSVSGAEKLKLTFSAESFTEQDYDVVYVFDGDGALYGEYSGDLSGVEVTVSGDTVQVQLVSDSSVNKYGYAFSSITAYTVCHPENIITGSAPDCTQAGISDGSVCEICGVVIQEQEILPALGHDEVIDEAIAPSCTVTGWTEGKHCDRCGEVLVPQEELTTSGHSYGEWTTTKLPTFTAEGSQSRTCGLCGNVESETIPAAVAEVEKWNIVIQDELVVNLHLDVTQLIEKTTKVKVTVGTKTSTLNLTDLEKTEEDLYVAKIELSAAQMTEDIIIMVINGSKIGCTEMYSVRQYADTLLEDDSQSQYHALIREMLNYGAAAQTYFDYKTDALANEGITDAGAEEVPETVEDDLSITGSAEGISFYAASLLYRDKVAVRFYFTGSTDGCSFTSNGVSFEAAEKDGLYYIEVSDILPQDLDQQITLTVTDESGNTMTVTYSPMNYMVRMNQKGSDELKALLKALYNYHLAAKNLQA